MCVSTLRLIRPVNEASTVEVMKEFFFLTGCLLCDKPVHSRKDAEEELRKGGGTDIDIILNLNVFYWEDDLPKWSDIARQHESAWLDQEWADSSIGNSGFVLRNDHRVFVTYQPPKRKKMKFYRKLIDRLIFQIWNSEEETLQREQLLILNRLYFKHHLLGFLQSKRALRMMNMGEALEFDLGQQTIPVDGYIRDMLLAFDRFYQDTVELQREPKVSPYTYYANINIARKIREVFQMLEKNRRPNGVRTVAFQVSPIAARDSCLRRWENSTAGNRSIRGPCFLRPASVKASRLRSGTLGTIIRSCLK